MMTLESDIGELSRAIDDRDSQNLRKLSNKFSSEAVFDQSAETISLAIISYCIHKALSKTHYSKKIDKLMYYVRQKLSKNDLEGAVASIKSFDDEHGLSHGNLVHKASIKVGTRIYSRGISLRKSTELVNVKISDILSYAGQTKGDQDIKHRKVVERLEVTRELFK